MITGLLEIGAGIVLVVYPEPVTTGAGLALFTDGVSRVADALNKR